MSNKIHYITVATKPHPILKNIENRVLKQCETIQILGLEENRDIGWQGTGNFGVKLRYVYEFLKNPDILDNDIVLFTDAYDVIYCGNQKDIIDRFLELDKPIIFGAERLCNPDPQREGQYTFKSTEFPFLNSGLFIGWAWALRICMMDYQYKDSDDDQRYWTTQFLEHSSFIGLDYDNKLFLNTADIDINDVIWNKDEGKAEYKGRLPKFVHINGPDKRDLMIFT